MKVSKHGKGMIYPRGNVWWIKFYDNGRPRYESSRSTKETDAKRLLSLRVGQVVEGKCPAPEAQRASFEDLALDLKNEYQSNERRSIRSLMGRFAHLRLFFGSLRASAITTSEAQKYIVKRQGEGPCLRDPSRSSPSPVTTRARMSWSRSARRPTLSTPH